MIEFFTEPFSYAYMRNAIWVSTLIGGMCAFLSCFLILKGWSLIGDALSHSIVPGVAGAYMLGLPFAFGAFITAGLAAAAMLFLKAKTRLREDAVIGLVFTGFFALGLFMVSVSPVPIDIQTIILGNILAIAPDDLIQLGIIGILIIVTLACKWRDFAAIFFDEIHARSIGLPVGVFKFVFFTLLALACVAAMQTVGAFLVIAMVITPGAAGLFWFQRFSELILAAIATGMTSGFLGAFISYYLNAEPGGIIVLVQTMIFAISFLFAPKTGYFSQKRAQNRGVQND